MRTELDDISAQFQAAGIDPESASLAAGKLHLEYLSELEARSRRCGEALAECKGATTAAWARA